VALGAYLVWKTAVSFELGAVVSMGEMVAIAFGDLPLLAGFIRRASPWLSVLFLLEGETGR
jgi:hypothetical protein